MYTTEVYGTGTCARNLVAPWLRHMPRLQPPAFGTSTKRALMQPTLRFGSIVQMVMPEISNDNDPCCSAASVVSTVGPSASMVNEPAPSAVSTSMSQSCSSSSDHARKRVCIREEVADARSRRHQRSRRLFYSTPLSLPSLRVY